jgi:hypothetical protein
MKTRKDEPRPDQWNGEDVEPVFRLRKPEPDRNLQDENLQAYVATYFEGDRFS